MNKLHVDLLLALRAADKFGLGTDELLTDLRQGRHRELSEPQLEQALRDLADRSFARTFTSALEKRRWRITQFGRDTLGEEGL